MSDIIIRQEHAPRGAKPLDLPIEQMRALRQQGLAYAKIGEIVGCSEHVARSRLNGEIFRRQRAAVAQHNREHAAVIHSLKHKPRCKLCGIILERSGCVGHKSDSPDAKYCWSCRQDYPSLCEED